MARSTTSLAPYLADDLLDRLPADGPIKLDGYRDLAVAYALKAFPDILVFVRSGSAKVDRRIAKDAWGEWRLWMAVGRRPIMAS